MSVTWSLGRGEAFTQVSRSERLIGWERLVAFAVVRREAKWSGESLTLARDSQRRSVNAASHQSPRGNGWDPRRVRSFLPRERPYRLSTGRRVVGRCVPVAAF